MRHRTEYQQTKVNALEQLRQAAKEAKKRTDDVPAILQDINDTADAISKDLPASLTYAQRERITEALQNLACTLHPLTPSEKKRREEQQKRQRQEENEWAYHL